ncbi:hypothetical protein FIA58_014640 [Flavobacterium jejuense]|uniref:Uncharacterized protein n=1 Tax=Flavobacterium jejuense TaxID=1544455 RepID=A0ABX0IYU3_9FLAO|nr:hypothetical protein [Flavobacterium jejuense]NHN26919.1 hypothetical protein [Flavobacterium jejuense]
MKVLKIYITNESDKLIAFLVDREIIDDLYITFDLTKVLENYTNFNINYEELINLETTKQFFYKNEVLILSIKLDDDNHVQFLIEKNISLQHLKKVPENVIPKQFKKIISNAIKTTYLQTVLY